MIGTNGKGTVTTMLAAGLTAAGHVTGRFLSPHVESFTERVAVDGLEISRSAVLDFTRRAIAASAPGGALDDLPDHLRPAFFEWTLALALQTFSAADLDNGVDYAVLEAGVGGKDDATSAVVADNVALVVLTNVDLDHTDTLGTTVEAIAAEKAGAIAPGVPVVTGSTGGALAVIAAVAAERGSPLHVDLPDDPLFAVPKGGIALVSAPPTTPSGTRLANARLACAGLRLLGVPEAAIAVAVTAKALPGRGERFHVDGVNVLLDGAHDPAAAARLVDEVEGPYVLLFGSLARKQGRATLAVLAEDATAVVITEAQDGEGLAAFASSGYPLVPAPDEALATALSLAGRGGTVVVAGSLYLAGRLRPLLHSRTA